MTLTVVLATHGGVRVCAYLHIHVVSSLLIRHFDVHDTLHCFDTCNAAKKKRKENIFIVHFPLDHVKFIYLWFIHLLLVFRLKIKIATKRSNVKILAYKI